jgi:hypothetical protein
MDSDFGAPIGQQEWYFLATALCQGGGNLGLGVTVPLQRSSGYQGPG